MYVDVFCIWKICWCKKPGGQLSLIPSPLYNTQINQLYENFSKVNWLVVSNVFLFSPQLRKIPFFTNIFQRGWFNHQLVNFGFDPPLGRFFFVWKRPRNRQRHLFGWQVTIWQYVGVLLLAVGTFTSRLTQWVSWGSKCCIYIYI